MSKEPRLLEMTDALLYTVATRLEQATGKPLADGPHTFQILRFDDDTATFTNEDGTVEVEIDLHALEAPPAEMPYAIGGFLH